MNVLIVGLGSIAHKHIEALNRIDHSIQIFAWRSSRASKHWEGIIDLFDWKDLQAIKFNFAIISNPTAQHEESIRAISKLHLPLFIEKPLFHKLDIKNLVLKIHRDSIISYVACNLRFLGSLQFIKKYIHEFRPTINEVNVYCGSYLPDWRTDIDYKQNYSAIPELGGGVHIDLIHEIDYLYWLFGFPDKVHRIFRNSSSLGIQSYDYANYCLEYSRFSAEVILNYYRRDAKRTLELICTDGTITVDLIKNSVMKNGHTLYHSQKQIKNTYFDQMKYFTNCVLNNKQTFNTITDAYHVLNICLES